MTPNVEKDITSSSSAKPANGSGSHHMLNPFVHKLELVDPAEKIKVSLKKHKLSFKNILFIKINVIKKIFK